MFFFSLLVFAGDLKQGTHWVHNTAGAQSDSILSCSIRCRWVLLPVRFGRIDDQFDWKFILLVSGISPQVFAVTSSGFSAAIVQVLAPISWSGLFLCDRLCWNFQLVLITFFHKEHNDVLQVCSERAYLVASHNLRLLLLSFWSSGWDFFLSSVIRLSGKSHSAIALVSSRLGTGKHSYLLHQLRCGCMSIVVFWGDIKNT